jgi:hypothetical protein
MSLIPCPDCGRDVSDVAPTCPQCGRPIAKAIAVQAVGESLITTQGTSKRLKAQALLSLVAAGFGVGFVLLYNAMEPADRSQLLLGSGEWLIGLGIMWYLITELRIWWNHA